MTATKTFWFVYLMDGLIRDGTPLETVDLHKDDTTDTWTILIAGRTHARIHPCGLLYGVPRYQLTVLASAEDGNERDLSCDESSAA